MKKELICHGKEMTTKWAIGFAPHSQYWVCSVCGKEVSWDTLNRKFGVSKEGKK